MKKGFTLIELVIVIVIVGILSIVAVPVYNQYVEKAKLTEGMAALSAIKIAQDIYFAQHEIYQGAGDGVALQYDDILGVDVRANKYFKRFITGNTRNADHGYARVLTDKNEMITYDWARPDGNFDYSINLNGVYKRIPYMYITDENGKSTYI